MYKGQMVFVQVTGRESLHETVLCLLAVPSHLYHLGLPQRLVRSNIAHANHRRNWKIFYDIAKILSAQARTFYQTQPLDFNFDACVCTRFYDYRSLLIDVSLPRNDSSSTIYGQGDRQVANIFDKHYARPFRSTASNLPILTPFPDFRQENC